MKAYVIGNEFVHPEMNEQRKLNDRNVAEQKAKSQPEKTENTNQSREIIDIPKVTKRTEMATISAKITFVCFPADTYRKPF